MSDTRQFCPTCGAPKKRPAKEPKTALAKRRAELGLSLQQVANIAGITKAQVWEIEREDRTVNPRMETLIGLAKALQWQVMDVILAIPRNR